MKAILQLGRLGDIINVLPIAYKIHQDTGEKPGFIVQEMYADILDGVSYVEPLIYNGEWTDVAGVLNTFHDHDISIAQIYGHGVIYEPRTDSFCKDSWLSAGFEYDSRIPLYFDQRSPEREHALISEHVDDGGTILVNLSGNSSPFKYYKEIIEVLYAGVGLTANIIDLSTIRAERIYDLLGLYDTADLLITADTATLHLAHASDIPNISFIVDNPTMWHGSVPKGYCILDIRYSNVLKNMTKIHDAIYKVLCL